MRLKTTVRTLLVTLAAAGCALDIEPLPPEVPVEIKLDFCSNEIPIWFAYQSRPQDPYSVISPDAAGTYTIQATSRTAISFVRQTGADYKTHHIFTSGGDLQKISGLACLEEQGTKQVNGTVTGLSGSQLGLVGMAFSSVFLTAEQTAFTLTQLPDRPLDVLASRVNVSGNEQHAQKTIIRRSQNPTSGSTMAALNWDTEGVVAVSNIATVNGVESNDAAFMMNNFFSQLETSHTLSFVDEPISDGAVPFVSIPAAELATGDYHDLFLIATSTSGGVRGIERFFRNPANQTLTLGPVLQEPSVTLITTEPTVLLRTTINGQVDYSTVITLDYHQETQFSTVDVTISVTASYIGGTPNIWNLPQPDLSLVSGWDDSWSLKSGGSIQWTVTGYFGRPELLFGAKPNDNDVVQFASRSSSISATQAFGAARRSPRPRHFSRLR